MSKLEVHTMPEEFTLAFVAAWRVMERCLNPVFSFPIKCNKCGKMSDAQHSQGPSFVTSNKSGKHRLIGMQCHTDDCDMVIKFEKPISSADKSFPNRLVDYPPSVLQKPDGTKQYAKRKDLELLESLLELSGE